MLVTRLKILLWSVFSPYQPLFVRLVKTPTEGGISHRDDSIKFALSNEFGDILFFFLGIDSSNLYFISLYQSDFEKKRGSSTDEDYYYKLYSTHFSFLIERFYENSTR